MDILSFQGRRIDSGSLQWAFRSANHGWKSFLTLNSFPAHMRYFKNLKSTWHKNLSCSCQLQTIFWSLTPHLHVLIMIWNVYVSQKDGVLQRSNSLKLSTSNILLTSSSLMVEPQSKWWSHKCWTSSSLPHAAPNEASGDLTNVKQPPLYPMLPLRQVVISQIPVLSKWW